MKMKKSCKHISCIRKPACALLASCLLLSSCGQISSEENNSSEESISGTSSPSPQPTPTGAPEVFPDTTPEPTPTAAPEIFPDTASEPTPTAAPEVSRDTTPEPTPTGAPEVSPDTAFGPTPSWIFPIQSDGIDDISDVFSAETQNNVSSLAYNPYGYPELFARYHGRINSREYIIDVIKIQPEPRIMGKNLIRLQFYNSSYWYEDPELIQELNIYLDSYELMGMDNFMDTFDINNDGHTDFRLNLGIDVKNEYYLYFVYDEKTDEYAYLGLFSYPVFFPDEQILYETSYFTNYSEATKYKIEGSRAVTVESAAKSMDASSCLYTYKKCIDDKLVTVIETNSYNEFTKTVDVSEWPGIDWQVY